MTVTFRVVGVTFCPAYPENLHLLRDAMDAWQTLANAAEGPAVVLERNPANPHDRNAIEVHVPSLGDERARHIGHVPRALAARWAPKLDQGATPRAWVTKVQVDPNNEHRPGIDVTIDWRTPAEPGFGGGPE